MSHAADESIIDKRYRIIHRVGRGGYGQVYRAFDELLKREVAVKILSSLSSASESQMKVEIEKLHREAKATAQIKHPNIVSTYAIGTHPPSSVYLVMEYVEGPSLSSILQEIGPLPLKVALTVFLQIASALATLHENNVLHRDLNPRNVLLLADGTEQYLTKLLDFGLAKLERKAGEAVSHTGRVVGTVGYMSPEQCLSLPFDKRSEVYAFGLLMYQTLTGKAAHPNHGPRALFFTVKEYPRSLQDVAPAAKIPTCMQNIVFRAISKDPADRYQSFEEVSADLQRVYDALVNGEEMPAIDPPLLRAFPIPEKHKSGSALVLKAAGYKNKAMVAAAIVIGLVLLTQIPQVTSFIRNIISPAPASSEL